VTRTDPHLTRSRRTFTVRLTTPALDGAAHGHIRRKLSSGKGRPHCGPRTSCPAPQFSPEPEQFGPLRSCQRLLRHIRLGRRLSPAFITDHRPSHCSPTPRGNLRHRLRIDHPVSGPHPTLRSEEPSRPCHRPILPAGPSREPATDVHHRGGASEFARNTTAGFRVSFTNGRTLDVDPTDVALPDPRDAP